MVPHLSVPTSCSHKRTIPRRVCQDSEEGMTVLVVPSAQGSSDRSERCVYRFRGTSGEGGINTSSKCARITRLRPLAGSAYPGSREGAPSEPRGAPSHTSTRESPASATDGPPSVPGVPSLSPLVPSKAPNALLERDPPAIRVQLRSCTRSLGRQAVVRLVSSLGCSGRFVERLRRSGVCPTLHICRNRNEPHNRNRSVSGRSRKHRSYELRPYGYTANRACGFG